MFLDYLSLVLLLLSLTAVFFLFIYIHDLPHKIAKAREHPHEEAIHVACWLSLFTLHAMWPLVFTWAVSHKKHQLTVPAGGPLPPPAVQAELAHHQAREAELVHRVAALEARLAKLEAK